MGLLRGLSEDFEELMGVEGLRLEMELKEEVVWFMDPLLAEVLIMNLFQNAIRHNVEGGEVRVELGRGSLRISNTGNPPEFPTEMLFQRFKKGHQENGSIGLGLSIVKRICDLNGMVVSYTYVDGCHVLEVKRVR